jgi:hypothetical protein
VPPADIVTLGRVLNVYPDWERLAALSGERARRLYGIIIPRNTLFVRLVISAVNMAMRLKGKRIRAAIVPIGAIDGLLGTMGFRRHSSTRAGPAWQVAIYRRIRSQT